MKGLTKVVHDWLTEIEETEAAKIIKNCIVKNTYVDTFFVISGDRTWDSYDVQVYVPGKYYKKLNEMEGLIKKIKQAIIDVAYSDNVIVHSVEWKPMISRKSNPQEADRKEEITKCLNSEYVNKQIALMNENLKENPHLSIGLAKELIETYCKSILKNKNKEIDKNWDLMKLVKETNKVINIKPKGINNSDGVEISIKKILSGFSNIVHGITELRNNFGSGHGHEKDFKSLDQKYARLVVAASSEIAIFYLNSVNK